MYKLQRMTANRTSGPDPSGPPLLARVFVLKLAEDPGSGRLVGRLEHVISGRAQDFASVQELLVALQRFCQARPP